MKYKWPASKWDFELLRAAAHDKYAPLVKGITSAPELYGLWEAVRDSLEEALAEVRADSKPPDPGTKLGR